MLQRKMTCLQMAELLLNYLKYDDIDITLRPNCPTELKSIWEQFIGGDYGCKFCAYSGLYKIVFGNHLPSDSWNFTKLHEYIGTGGRRSYCSDALQAAYNEVNKPYSIVGLYKRALALEQESYYGMLRKQLDELYFRLNEIKEEEFP